MQEFQVYLQSHLSLATVLEIMILTFVFYQLFSWIRGTQAEQVVKGAVVLLVLMPISEICGLTTMTFLLQSIFAWAFLLIAVVFRPELRSALGQLGNNRFLNKLMWTNKEIKQESKAIETITVAVRELSEKKTGALIICENHTGLMDLTENGVILDAKMSPNLITNLFFKNAPLHDGAILVSIREDRVIAAACIVPTSDKQNLPRHFGTRHRAGIGTSDHVPDAVVIVVSEETGKITLVHQKIYEHGVTPEDVKAFLENLYVLPLLEKESESFPKARALFRRVFKHRNEE